MADSIIVGGEPGAVSVHVSVCVCRAARSPARLNLFFAFPFSVRQTLIPFGWRALRQRAKSAGSGERSIFNLGNGLSFYYCLRAVENCFVKYSFRSCGACVRCGPAKLS